MDLYNFLWTQYLNDPVLCVFDVHASVELRIIIRYFKQEVVVHPGTIYLRTRIMGVGALKRMCSLSRHCGLAS
jgi:hypothetical protein